MRSLDARWSRAHGSSACAGPTYRVEAVLRRSCAIPSETPLARQDRRERGLRPPLGTRPAYIQGGRPMVRLYSEYSAEPSAGGDGPQRTLFATRTSGEVWPGTLRSGPTRRARLCQVRRRRRSREGRRADQRHQKEEEMTGTLDWKWISIGVVVMVVLNLIAA